MHSEKQIEVFFEAHQKVVCNYDEELKNFLDSIEKGTKNANDVRIFSTYFQQQWPAASYDRLPPYLYKYLGYNVRDVQKR